MRKLLMHPAFLLTAVLLLIFYSCKPAENLSTVDQDRVFTEYYLTYDEDNDVTTATAIFRFGNALGTNLKLDMGSQVSFNGDVMSEATEPVSQLTYYKKEYAGLVNSGTFTWTDIDGNSYSNLLTVAPIGFPQGLDSINRSNAFQINWTGAPLVQGESVAVTGQETGGNGNTLRIWTQNGLGSNSIILTAGELQELNTGLINLYMDRYLDVTPAQAPGAGGKMRSTWKDKLENVVLY